jgi:hypothetical protein
MFSTRSDSLAGLVFRSQNCSGLCRLRCCMRGSRTRVQAAQERGRRVLLNLRQRDLARAFRCGGTDASRLGSQ